ncbi:MAG: Tol biopolymer transporter periplasmic protein [Cyanobacteriota bacterium]|nr:Tol biopolymer transporter periplasmic protein [Cyanobacteriota bacterium]
MTIRPASTTDPLAPRSCSLAIADRLKIVPVLLGLCWATQACAAPWQARRSAGPTGLLGQETDRQEPALSGNGQWLATLLLRDGRPSLLLQEQPSGRRVPLPNLRGLTPHRSPSLSWNGRYVALVVQQGPRRQAVVDDRASGRLHRIQLPMGLEPERLSLAPDGRRLAIATVVQGRPQVQLFDLSGVLEPDLPPAQALRGPATPMETP